MWHLSGEWLQVMPPFTCTLMVCVNDILIFTHNSHHKRIKLHEISAGLRNRQNITQKIQDINIFRNAKDMADQLLPVANDIDSCQADDASLVSACDM